MKTWIPPIKCQGIKTKLVPLIRELVSWDGQGTWIEPFMGSGVVGFNMRPKRAIFADSNPHIIRFYDAIAKGVITAGDVRQHLTREGAVLLEEGEAHYYAIRERFNQESNPLDFLFLNRACFNGVMRFNRKGGFNVPFCRKPNRFAQAYVTKIVNQVEAMASLAVALDWQFICQPFEDTVRMAACSDFIYADPPYVGRHVDYFDSWDEAREHRLYSVLSESVAKFMLSTWEENEFRRNEFIDRLWGEFPKVNEDHFYHVGAQESNRNPMKEALVMNYDPPSDASYRKAKRERVQLAMSL